MISIKGSKDYLVALESVAMTDIVLNMFIFFFISFSLMYTFDQARMSKIEIRLPKASSAVSMEGYENTILTVTRQGIYFINDERAPCADLKKILASRLKENPSLSIVVKVDSSTRFNNVVKALDVINELNIRKVGIAALKEKI